MKTSCSFTSHPYSLVFYFILCYLCTGCADKEDKLPTPGDSLKKLEAQGYLIRGLKDQNGIRNNLLYIDQNRDLSKYKFPSSEKFREMGLDESFRNLPDLDFLKNLGVELVDLFPWAKEGGSGHPMEELRGKDTLQAGMPSSGSLVGNTDYYFSYSVDNPDGTKADVLEVVTIDDEGSSTREYRYSISDGTRIVDNWVYNQEGDVIHHSTEWYDRKGNLVDRETSDESRPVSPPPPSNPFGDDEGREEVAVNDGQEGDGEDGDEEGMEGLKPADGEAIYCPLHINYCRMAVEKLLKGSNPEQLKLAFLRINPAEDNQAPNAPRLRLNPEDFVINPDPSASPSTGKPRRGTEVILPVLVNPPGPNEN